MTTQRSPKAMQHRSGALLSQSQAHEAGSDVKNEFPLTFNYESFEAMKKQLSFLQEELEHEKKKRVELEMRHSQSDQIRSTSKVSHSVPFTTIISHQIPHNNSPPNKSSIKPCKPKTFEGNLNENALLWVNAMQRYLELSTAPE